MPFGIDDAFERLQPVADPSPRWTDEMSFSAWDPGSGHLLLARVTVHPNRQRTSAAAHVWAGDELRRSLTAGGDLGPTDWDVLSVGDAVTVRLVASGQTWALQLDGDGIRAHLEWDGTSPVVRYDDHPDGPLPPTIARGHYDQPTRVRGDLVIDGERIAFDGRGQREHSWGFPRWTRLHQWHWLVGVLDDGRTLAVLDALHDDATTTIHGYVAGPERTAFVVEAERDVVLDELGGVARVDLALRTDDGGSLALTGVRHGPAAGRRPHGDGTVIVHDVPMRFEVGGGGAGRGLYEALVTEFD
jgi:hypothetical protein